MTIAEENNSQKISTGDDGFQSKASISLDTPSCKPETLSSDISIAEERLKMWECKSCGLLEMNKKKPEDCSCGTPRWFNNAQIDVYISAISQSVEKATMKKCLLREKKKNENRIEAIKSFTLNLVNDKQTSNWHMGLTYGRTEEIKVRNWRLEEIKKELKELEE